MGEVIVIFFPLGFFPRKDVDGIHSRELCSTTRPSGSSILTMFSDERTAFGQQQLDMLDPSVDDEDDV